jgi:hypothetical protein
VISSLTIAAQKAHFLAVWMSIVLCANLGKGYSKKTKKWLERVVQMYIMR